MFNMYFAWKTPLRKVITDNLFFWNGSFRPLGVVFYRVLYAVAGFNPVPLHVVYLILGLLNLAICFWFLHLVTDSLRTAALGTLIFAFHSRLMEVWFRTAVVYDVLCFTFVYLAACLYIWETKRRPSPEPARLVLIAVCFLLAMDAKEMAIALPVLLLCYEICLVPGRQLDSTGGRRSRFAFLGFLLVMAVIYTTGKLTGPMVKNPDYTPHYSVARFADTWSTYLGQLLIRPGPLKHRSAFAILAVTLVAAAAVRSRKLLFAWSIIFFGLLPVSFVPGRGAFVMYISWVGWSLYAAVAIGALEDRIGRYQPRWSLAISCIVFVLVGYRMGKTNLHDQRADPRHWLYDDPARTRALVSQIKTLQPAFPAKTSILFEDDAFGNDEYTPLFILSLLYHDPDLTVDRDKLSPNKPLNPADYQYVFTFQDGHYRQLKPVE